MNLTQCLIPSIQPNVDQFGMVQPDGADTSDNGILWTAYYVAGLQLKGLMTDDEKLRLNTVFGNNFIEPGLMQRYPTSPDFEAQDDHCGILMADALMNSGKLYAESIHSYGSNIQHCLKVDPRESNTSVLKQDKLLYMILNILFLGRIKWNYNPVSPNSFSIYSWLGRRMELCAQIEMTAKKPVNPLYWTYWALVMLSNTFSKPNISNSVADVLHYCSALSCEGYGPLTNLICKMFRRSVHKKFGDIGYMFGWSNQHPDHPLVKFLEGVY